MNAANAAIELAGDHAMVGQRAEAEAAHDRAIDLRPDHAQVRMRRGEMYATMGLWDLAFRDYARSFDRRPPESWRVEPSAIVGGRDAIACERVLLLTGPRPDPEGSPEQRRLHSLIDAAARRWPEARWTVASLDGEPITRPDDLGDAGIEAVTGAPSWQAWLTGRRFHYGIVALADSRWGEGELGDQLNATQPQAVRIPVTDRVDLGAVASTLGRPDPGIWA